jgi:hypothetical protein
MFAIRRDNSHALHLYEKCQVVYFVGRGFSNTFGFIGAIYTSLNLVQAYYYELSFYLSILVPILSFYDSPYSHSFVY